MNQNSYIEKKYEPVKTNEAYINLEEVVEDLIHSFREYKLAITKKDIIKYIIRNQ